MTRMVVAILSVLTGLVGQAQAAAPAAPVAVAPFGVVEGTTHRFTWRAAAGATWYQLWVMDSASNPRLAEWLTAQQAGCAGGTGQCSFELSAGLATGPATWWVRGWNTDGNGAWSAGKAFALTYRPPSWAAAIATAERFQVVLDGNWVLDRQTGLVWQKQPLNGTTSWVNALTECFFDTSGLGRLPTLQELRSIILAVVNATGATPFGDIGTQPFWSATLWPGDNAKAMYADAGGLGVHPTAQADRVWCVMGAG